jgi:hypothetical protein
MSHDLGIIAAPAIFQEHCRQNRKPHRYQNAKKIEKSRQEFLMTETINGLFVAGNLVRWLNKITHPFQQNQVVAAPSAHAQPNIFSPVHLIVDAFSTRFVPPQLSQSNCSGK